MGEDVIGCTSSSHAWPHHAVILIGSLPWICVILVRHGYKYAPPFTHTLSATHTLPLCLPALLHRSAVVQAQSQLSPGSNFLLLNGLVVEVDKGLDYYGLLSRLLAEASLADALAAAGLGADLAREVLRLRASEERGALGGLRLELGGSKELSKAGVMWLNDLEKDKQYARYSANIMELLHTMPGR